MTPPPLNETRGRPLRSVTISGYAARGFRGHHSDYLPQPGGRCPRVLPFPPPAIACGGARRRHPDYPGLLRFLPYINLPVFANILRVAFSSDPVRPTRLADLRCGSPRLLQTSARHTLPGPFRQKGALP